MGRRSEMEVRKDWLVLECQGLLDVSSFIEYPPIKLERETCDIIQGKTSSRYNHPAFKELHYDCKNKLEHILQEKLYPTYYFDRFYFNGSMMNRHVDRESCEISVSVNISSNLDHDWGLWFELGDSFECFTSPGDAVIYRGIEVPHWRKKMVGNKKSYFHQLFLHYVRADGHYLEYAYDRRS